MCRFGVGISGKTAPGARGVGEGEGRRGVEFLRSELADSMICSAVNVHLADCRDTGHNSFEQRQIAMAADMKATGLVSAVSVRPMRCAEVLVRLAAYVLVEALCATCRVDNATRATHTSHTLPNSNARIRKHEISLQEFLPSTNVDFELGYRFYPSWANLIS